MEKIYIVMLKLQKSDSYPKDRLDAAGLLLLLNFQIENQNSYNLETHLLVFASAHGSFYLSFLAIGMETSATLAPASLCPFTRPLCGHPELGKKSAAPVRWP